QRWQRHSLFTPPFCLVRRPNEKGHVERLLDYGRSNFLVPVPHGASLAELNAQLEARCRGDLGRSVRGKPGTVATLLLAEQAAFLPLPGKPFEARRGTPAAPGSLSPGRFDPNACSAAPPVAPPPPTVVAT